MSRLLADYSASQWRIDKAEAVCPAVHIGKKHEFAWKFLDLHPIPLRWTRIRQVLRT